MTNRAAIGSPTQQTTSAQMTPVARPKPQPNPLRVAESGLVCSTSSFATGFGTGNCRCSKTGPRAAPLPRSGSLSETGTWSGCLHAGQRLFLPAYFSLTLSYAIPGRKGFGQLLEGWAVNSAVLIQSGLPWSPVDTRDISKSGDKRSDRWDFFGNPSDFKAGKYPIPFYAGSVIVGGSKVINPNLPASCVANATAIGTFNPATPNAGNLFSFGCFA